MAYKKSANCSMTLEILKEIFILIPNAVKGNAKQDNESRLILMCSTVALVYLVLQIPYIIWTVID